MIGRRSSQREINDDSGEEVYVNEAHSGKGMGSCEDEGEEDEDHLGADLLLVHAPDNCPAPQTINQGVRCE